MEYENLTVQDFEEDKKMLTIIGEKEEIEQIVSDLFKKESKPFESKSEFISPKQLLETVNEKNPFEPEIIEFETGESETEEYTPDAKFSTKNFKVGDVVYFKKDSLMFEKNEIFEITDITNIDVDVELLNGNEFCYSHKRFIELEPTVVDIKHNGLFERLKFAKKLGETLTDDTDFSGVKGYYNKDDEFGNVGDIVIIKRDDKDHMPLCLNYTREKDYYYELSDLWNVCRKQEKGE